MATNRYSRTTDTWIRLGLIVAVSTVAYLLDRGLNKQEERHKALEFSSVCDVRGVCCYESRTEHGISCVATTIKVVVLPGDVYDGKSQGDKPLSGEVGSRALEERVLQQFGGTFRPAN